MELFRRERHGYDPIREKAKKWVKLHMSGNQPGLNRININNETGPDILSRIEKGEYPDDAVVEFARSYDEFIEGKER